PKTDAPKLRRGEELAERSTVTEYATPSVSGSFTELICGGDQARVVVDTAAGKKILLIADPGKISVVGVEGGKLDLQCGAQSPRPIRVEYAPASVGGVDGDVRVLYFEK